MDGPGGGRSIDAASRRQFTETTEPELATECFVSPTCCDCVKDQCMFFFIMVHAVSTPQHDEFQFAFATRMY